MRSSTIAFAVGLLALPLSLMATPDAPAPNLVAPTLVAPTLVAPTLVAPTLAAPTLAAPTLAAQAAAPLETSVNGRKLEDAPVPAVGPPGVAPVDRVAGPGSRTLGAGPVNSTPFSATPTGTLSGGSGGEASQADRTLAPGATVGTTPNLGR